MILYFVSSLPPNPPAHPCAACPKLGGRIYISRATPAIQWVTPHKRHDPKKQPKTVDISKGNLLSQMETLHECETKVINDMSRQVRTAEQVSTLPRLVQFCFDK